MSLCLLVLLSSPVLSQTVINIHDDFDEYALQGSSLEFLEDSEKTLTIDQVVSPDLSQKFKPNRQNIPNFGYTRSAYWFRFSINNNKPEKESFLLEVCYALLDYVTLYVPDSQGKYVEKTSGRLLPLGEREFRHRYFIFSIKMNSMQVKTIYLRVASEDSLAVPLKLFTLEAFAGKEHKVQYILGIFYGIIIVMILYNFFVYLSVRESCYLYYVLFIGVFLIYILSENGMAYEYLWPNSPWWGKRATAFHVGLVVFWSSFFVQKFLDTKKLAPELHKIIYVFSVAGAIGVLSSMILSYSSSIIYVVGLVALYSPVLMVTSFFCWRKGHRQGGFLLIASSCLLVGSIAYALKAFGIFPVTFLTQHGVEIGATLQVVLLSLGLADRINTMKKDLQSLNTNLELKVEERTKSLIENEAKYRQLVKYAPTGIYEIDFKEVKLLSVNDVMCDYTGYTREELLQTSPLDLLTDDSKKLFSERLLKLSAGEHVPETAEYEIKGKNDKKFWAFINARYQYENGKPTKATVVAYDITQRKQAEAERKKLETQLRQAQKMEAIGTLAGGIAHDFNNILGAIMGYTEMALLAVKDNGQLKKNLEEACKASNRAKDLVQQILAFSRKSDTERKPLLIGEIVKEALNMLRATLPTTIEIRENITTNSGRVSANSTQIHQVLMNLCTNAAQAMGEKGGILEVSLDEIDLDSSPLDDYKEMEPGPYIRLAVSDTGHGMTPDVIEKIFEPYFTTKIKGVGTGMGLAVVHGIVEDHGGHIKIHSELDKGTTFSIFLPRIESESTTKVESIAPPPNGNERILYVDDEEALVRIGQQMLEHLGYEVVGRTSSIEALEAFRAQPGTFDLVITDQTMPNMTGAELASELMLIRENIPVIICTGYSEVLTREKAESIGIRALIMKPLVLDDLAQNVRQVLDQN